jgi:ribosome recycling factor
MEKALGDLQHALSSIRTGRASVSIFDNVRVDYYGTATPLNQMASVHAPEPQLLTVQPWDQSQVGAVEKAIRDANLGLNPQSQGGLIRVPLPMLSEERRKELVKICSKLVEEPRVMRQARRDANERLKEMSRTNRFEDNERDAWRRSKTHQCHISKGR